MDTKKMSVFFWAFLANWLFLADIVIFFILIGVAITAGDDSFLQSLPDMAVCFSCLFVVSALVAALLAANDVSGNGNLRPVAEYKIICWRTNPIAVFIGWPVYGIYMVFKKIFASPRS